MPSDRKRINYNQALINRRKRRVRKALKTPQKGAVVKIVEKGQPC